MDALDECDGDDNIGKIIELLAERQDPGRLQLRILLTSRPEVPIRHGFDHGSNALLQRYVLHRISPDIVNADITLFLKQNLMTIDWPGPEMIAKITQRAGGLFIWAAIACRCIRQGRRFAVQRLISIMKQDGDSPVGPEKYLHNLYLTVLRDSPTPEYTTEEKEDQCKMQRLALGTLTVQQLPLSVQALGHLLNIGKEGIERTVQGLHAIPDIPKDEDESLQLHHPSLHDFLLDRNPGTDVNFSIDEAKAHGVLALQCDELMTRFVQQDQEYYEKIRSTNNPERTS
ncbi:hypothetical protein J4E91_005291 [Alternaria rosae]|nr:hypothetical protein J4E91_005291 [Alternaria rosae]